MAKAAKKAPKKKYILLSSACGDECQIQTDMDTVKVYESIDAAKKASSAFVVSQEFNNDDRPTKVWIAELVVEGKVDGVNWA